MIDQHDSGRFLLSLKLFNSVEPIGSLYLLSFNPPRNKKDYKPLVEIVSYCLNPNHYHLVLKQLTDGGISELMKRLNGGYAWYFNNKHKRSGALFQGKFKSVHIDDNDYLLHLSVYVNLNYKVHQLSGRTAKLCRSSWEEYVGNSKEKGLCKKDIVLEQFKNKSDYRNFAEDSVKGIIEGRKEDILIDNLLIE